MNGITALGLKIAAAIAAVAFAAGIGQGKIAGLEARLDRIEVQLQSLTDTLIFWHAGSHDSKLILRPSASRAPGTPMSQVIPLDSHDPD